MTKIVLITLLVFSNLSFAKSKVKRPRLKCPKQDNKTLLCHVPPGNPAKSKQLAISDEDTQDHLDHGDYLGWCEGKEYQEMKEECGICDVDIDPTCS